MYELLNNSSNKSSVLDPLPMFLLKSPKEQLVPVITKIVNFSLLSGTVPYQLRQAPVTSLLKKQGLGQSVLKNYRPASNLLFLSKILDKLLLSQLQTHLEKKKYGLLEETNLYTESTKAPRLLFWKSPVPCLTKLMGDRCLY